MSTLSLELKYGLRDLVWALGFRDNPKRPRHGWHESRLNTALQSNQEVIDSTNEVIRLGLKSHYNSSKNWDALTCLSLMLAEVTKESQVLEIGATLYSRPLRWLRSYGYKNLIGIDPDLNREIRRDCITYHPCTLDKASFTRNQFSAVMALSVIEHVKDLDSFCRDIAKVLRRGGICFISTDYWHDSIDTSGKTAYGAPVNIFNSGSIIELMQTARRHGLELSDPLSLHCNERTVFWQGFHFTFLCWKWIRV